MIFDFRRELILSPFFENLKLVCFVSSWISCISLIIWTSNANIIADVGSFLFVFVFFSASSPSPSSLFRLPPLPLRLPPFPLLPFPPPLGPPLSSLRSVPRPSPWSAAVGVVRVTEAGTRNITTRRHSHILRRDRHRLPRIHRQTIATAQQHVGCRRIKRSRQLHHSRRSQHR